MREREIQDCLDWYKWAVKNEPQALRNENGNFLKTIIEKYLPLNKSEISQLKELKLYLKNHLNF